MRRARPSRESGLSLLEMLVALVIMALSLGMLYQATGGAVRSIETTEQQQRAALLARSLLNQRDSVPPGGWAEQGASAGLAWRIDSAPFATDHTGPRAPGLHQVRIQVEWQDRNGPRQLALDTLLPQANPAAAGAAR
jgi:general secretion pathway protein I